MPLDTTLAVIDESEDESEDEDECSVLPIRYGANLTINVLRGMALDESDRCFLIACKIKNIHRARELLGEHPSFRSDGSNAGLLVFGACFTQDLSFLNDCLSHLRQFLKVTSVAIAKKICDELRNFLNVGFFPEVIREKTTWVNKLLEVMKRPDQAFNNFAYSVARTVIYAPEEAVGARVQLLELIRVLSQSSPAEVSDLVINSWSDRVLQYALVDRILTENQILNFHLYYRRVLTLQVYGQVVLGMPLIQQAHVSDGAAAIGGEVAPQSTHSMKQ